MSPVRLGAHFGGLAMEVIVRAVIQKLSIFVFLVALVAPVHAMVPAGQYGPDERREWLRRDVTAPLFAYQDGLVEGRPQALGRAVQAVRILGPLSDDGGIKRKDINWM